MPKRRQLLLGAGWWSVGVVMFALALVFQFIFEHAAQIEGDEDEADGEEHHCNRRAIAHAVVVERFHVHKVGEHRGALPAPLLMIETKSNARSESMIEITMTMVVTGVSSGMITWRKRLSRPAPSTRAASM